MKIFTAILSACWSILACIYLILDSIDHATFSAVLALTLMYVSDKYEEAE